MRIPIVHTGNPVWRLATAEAGAHVHIQGCMHVLVLFCSRALISSYLGSSFLWALRLIKNVFRDIYQNGQHNANIVFIDVTN